RLFLHQPERLLRAIEHAGQVHVDDLLPLFGRQVFEWKRRSSGASVIEKQIEPAELLLGLVEERPHGDGVGHVRGNDHGGRGDRGRRLFEGGGPAAGQHQRIAFFRQCQRRGPADPRTRPRDHRDFRGHQLTFFRKVTRPVDTHSTTKMLPSLSKAASCGWTNLPASHSFGCPRTLKPSSTFFRQTGSSPRCTIGLSSLSKRLTRACRSGTSRTSPRVLAWAGKSTVLPDSVAASGLPSSEKVCRRALARSHTISTG